MAAPKKSVKTSPKVTLSFSGYEYDVDASTIIVLIENAMETEGVDPNNLEEIKSFIETSLGLYPHVEPSQSPVNMKVTIQ
jgi:hypothetical protein